MARPEENVPLNLFDEETPYVKELVISVGYSIANFLQVNQSGNHIV